MKRLILIALLAACGDKKSDAPAATVGDVVKPETPLAEAKRLLTTVPKRDPKGWVALAHAQAVAKLPEAKQTLEAALAAARADAGDDGTIALVHAAEVAALLGEDATKLLDEAATRLAGMNVVKRGPLIAILMAPTSMLTYAPAVDRLATLSAELSVLEVVLDSAAPDRLPILAAKVRAVAEDKRFMLLVMLARQARRMGKPDRSFVDEAAKLVKKDDVEDVVEVALEAALHNDGALAKQLVERVPKIAHSQEASQRATTFATLAWIYALAGDKAAADGAEQRSIQAAKKDSEDNDDDNVWVYLAVARAKRGDLDGALTMIKHEIKDKKAEGDVAFFLADGGDLDGAQRVLAAMTSEHRFPATADLVEQLARRDPDAAKQLVLAAPQQKAMSPGIEHVLLAYALRGDVANVRELGMRDRMGTKQGQLDAFTALAARALARDGKCADALAASKAVAVYRAYHLAVIARFCP